MICKRFQTYAVQLTQQLLIIFILTALFCAMMRLSSLWGSSSKASVDKNYKYYTSVEVKNGDTLLDIASEYVTEEYGSLHEYVAEVKELNGLRSDYIRSGQSLVVPYYSAELK